METLAHMYLAKSATYIVAVIGMCGFVFYWKFLNATKVPAMAAVMDTAADLARRLGDMVAGFLVPQGVYYHPGHAWVRADGGNGVVSVGLDDFAQKLVGPIGRLELPEKGACLLQGEKGWALTTGGKTVEMLSPVDGEVLSVNEEIINDPAKLKEDPYQEGWLLKVKAPRLSPNLKNLISGDLARDWIRGSMERLSAMTSPEMGMATLQDGGMPIDGMARSLNSEGWDEIAREFFLTADAEE